RGRGARPAPPRRRHGRQRPQGTNQPPSSRGTGRRVATPNPPHPTRRRQARQNNSNPIFARHHRREESVTLYYQDDHVTLYHGDCMDVMASLPAESVDAIVTSPPYAMQRRSTYGGIPESEYPAWAVAWMAEARRILKPDGSVIINIRPHIKNGVISDYVLRTRLALRGDGWAELEELIWHKKDGAPMGSTSRPRRSYEHLLWYGKHGRPHADPKAAGPESSRL